MISALDWYLGIGLIVLLATEMVVRKTGEKLSPHQTWMIVFLYPILFLKQITSKFKKWWIIKNCFLCHNFRFPAYFPSSFSNHFFRQKRNFFTKNSLSRTPLRVSAFASRYARGKSYLLPTLPSLRFEKLL